MESVTLEQKVYSMFILGYEEENQSLQYVYSGL